MHHPFLHDQTLKMASALTAAEPCRLFYSGNIVRNKKNLQKEC